jgi:Asp-tRNA(Asn)/Glu-tRNA(Gln) amidotransferase A subunit family amidase
VAYSSNLGYFEISSDVRRACNQAAEMFSNLGCHVEEVHPAFDKDLEHHFLVLWYGKMASIYADLSEEEFSLLEPKVQELIMEGKKLSAVVYGRANLAREKVWNELLRLHEDYDLLICPTTAIPAFPIQQGAPTAINGRNINPLIGWFLTYPFNLTGNPVASIPCGFSDDGLPIGLQIIGGSLNDALVLRASRAFERVFPWPTAEMGKTP